MIAGMIVFSLLYVTLLIYRVRLEKVRDRIAARRQQLASS
jgi:hypothetical protein